MLTEEVWYCQNRTGIIYCRNLYFADVDVDKQRASARVLECLQNPCFPYVSDPSGNLEAFDTMNMRNINHCLISPAWISFKTVYVNQCKSVIQHQTHGVNMFELTEWCSNVAAESLSMSSARRLFFSQLTAFRMFPNEWIWWQNDNNNNNNRVCERSDDVFQSWSRFSN